MYHQKVFDQKDIYALNIQKVAYKDSNTHVCIHLYTHTHRVQTSINSSFSNNLQHLTSHVNHFNNLVLPDYRDIFRLDDFASNFWTLVL